VALQSRCTIESLFVAPEGHTSQTITALVAQAERAGARVFQLAPGVMERVADTVTPQPICAVVAALDVSLEALLALPAGDGASRLFLVCADVRDPGNLGAVLRIAAASGVSGVIACAGSVDPYNPKTVRASAGAVFQLPLVKAPAPPETLVQLQRSGVTLLGTRASGGTDYLVADYGGDVALVLGNEASGLPEELGVALDGALTIPMAEGTESLNVAMTAAVLCFEAARRRRLA